MRRLRSTLLAATAMLATSAAAAHAAPVLVVGDSLAVGMRPYLPALLGQDVTFEVKTGRTTPGGLPLLRARVVEAPPSTVVISLGTNDGGDPQRFADRIRRALAAVPQDACVLWADIFRPRRKGPYAKLNRALQSVARRNRRLVVVPWARAVRDGAVALPDGLHPDPAGYEFRARMFAAAAQQGCDRAGSGGTMAPPDTP